jgi:two-component system chemotaxis response regulator CheY
MAMTAIVVDDSAVSRALLKRGLNKAGVEVVAEASTGERALELYEEHRPTLTFFDIVLPQLDGVTAATRLLKLHPGAIVIICSAMASREKILAARQAGVTHFLLKPVTAEKIAEIALSILSRVAKPQSKAAAGAKG